MRDAVGFSRPAADAELEYHSAVADGEVVAGAYRQPDSPGRIDLIFSNAALYVFHDNGWARVPWATITNFEMPSKQMPTGVLMETTSGPVFVPMTGCFGQNGNQKDAFAFVMLLRNLLMFGV